jgi:hypothetical protein
MLEKINRIIKYIKEEFCNHEWIDMGKRVVYEINENDKPSSIPYAILYVRKCSKCGKVEELRMEIPNGL